MLIPVILCYILTSCDIGNHSSTFSGQLDFGIYVHWPNETHTGRYTCVLLSVNDRQNLCVLNHLHLVLTKSYHHVSHYVMPCYFSACNISERGLFT